MSISYFPWRCRLRATHHMSHSYPGLPWRRIVVAWMLFLCTLDFALAQTLPVLLTLTPLGKTARLAVPSHLSAASSQAMYQVVLNPALFAAETGSTFSLMLPGQTALTVMTERTLVNASGSRTWIGYIMPDRDHRIIITSSGDATFGRILTAAGVFKIEPGEGGSLLIDVGAAGLRQMPMEDDVQVPPTPRQDLHPRGAPAVDSGASPAPPAGADAATLAGGATSPPVAAAPPSGSNSVINVLVLYTQGMVTRYGAGLQARLDQLVALSNQAYIDSGIPLTIRISKSQLTTYSDTGPNLSALSDMASWKAPFNSLSAMRTAAGADLVSLLRPYDKATHGSCGQAYIAIASNLVGSNNINSNWAYSVVGDGTDVGGSGWYCGQYAFTHELGHNMGATHDYANAPTPGWFSNSYGYGVAGTFGTIMSYLNPMVGKFSSPSLICSGTTACGLTADPNATDAAHKAGADNVSTIKFVAPLVAAYSVTPATLQPHADLNGDGISDVIWRNGITGENYAWLMNGLNQSNQASLPQVGDPNWQIVRTADVNGDGKSDVIWRNSVTGENYLWLMNGVNIASKGYLPTVADSHWQVQATGDLNGDGRADLIWRNTSTGETYAWLMNGLSISGSGYLHTVSDQAWKIAGAGDLDGDGKADIVWHNASTGQNYLWLMNGFSIVSQGYLPTVADTNWSMVGIADLDSDGRADIVWRDGVTGQNYLWLMNGLNVTSQGYLPTVADLHWQVAGCGDFNGDGRADLVWVNPTTGENYLWIMNGLTTSAQGNLPAAMGPDWAMQGQ